MEYTFKTHINGKPLTIQTGKIAKQASGSAVVQFGETIVLVTVVAEKDQREGTDFLPLSVEYQEKIYAAGRIPGNYFRREIGRPSEREVLTCRLIDRPIRPLFPKNYFYETQVIATVLSTDKENDADVLAMVGASAALEVSDIPFQGPIAAVRVARIDGELIANPTLSQYQGDNCDINIVVAGSKTGIVMVEGGGNIISEKDMLDAVFFGHTAMQPIIDIQEQLKEAAGVEKRDVPPVMENPALAEKMAATGQAQLREALLTPEKMDRKKAVSAVKHDVMAKLEEDIADCPDMAISIWEKMLKTVSRDLILKEGIRMDGRKFDQVRPIQCEAGILPRPHGSALFTRGETQVLGILTLGSDQDQQRIETLVGEEFDPFMLHYNFPPYSVGEVKRPGGPSRRDIGHGTLAKRAIEKVLPSREDFGYTIRLVSEVLESNGSSSMGTVCAGILSLMDGGVPLQAPVSGIAMGLVKEDDNVVILTDILGDEDHTGDMDFKVAGTKDGITALQMDIKIHELPKNVMEKALEQARLGRLHILDKMMDAISESRDDISPHAPKIISVMINPDKIRDIIGPGGKMIRAIQAETNTRIEVSDDGEVKISATSQADADAATQKVKDIAMDPEPGKIYTGKVVKVTDFGAFVQLAPGTEGLVHISQLADYHVKKVTDIVKEGDELKVMVLETTRDGKIRLSRKAVLKENNEKNSK